MMKVPVMVAVLILASGGLHAQQPQLNPELKYVVALSESQVEFSVHSSLADVKGDFALYQAEFKVPTSRFEDISFVINVAASSVHTGSSTKDKMVKSDNFFWIQKYPFITFVSRKIIPDPNNPLKFAMEGNFSLRGVTKPVTLQLLIQPEGNQHGHIYADLSFDRRDFGMTYNMPFNRISDSVRVRFYLDVQGIPVQGTAASLAQ